MFTQGSTKIIKIHFKINNKNNNLPHYIVISSKKSIKIHSMIKICYIRNKVKKYINIRF